MKNLFLGYSKTLVSIRKVFDRKIVIEKYLKYKVGEPRQVTRDLFIYTTEGTERCESTQTRGSGLENGWT